METLNKPPYNFVWTVTTRGGPHLPPAAESIRPQHDFANSRDQHMAPLTALHKSGKTINNHLTEALLDTYGLCQNTAAGVHGTYLSHILRSTKT